MIPDARKHLQVLDSEWSKCTKCSLGERRVAVGGEYVAGEGMGRGIVFVGEGPGKDEEASGRPFVGASGQLLRRVLEKLAFEDYYITNLVSCRSCSAVTNPDGTPRFWQRKHGPPVQMWRDEPPLGVQIEACSPRFYEELYIVDPKLVVAMGVKACEALTHRPVTISKMRGQLVSIQVPGAWTKAVMTEKRGVWARKVKGELVLPIEQNMVEYMMMPTLHPAGVLRKLQDRDKDNGPLAQFINDIQMAVKIYERLMLEAFNREPTSRIQELTANEVLDAYRSDDEENPEEARTEVE